MTHYRIEDVLTEEMKDKSPSELKIINAAIKNFAEKGYHNTKTKDIAKDAGLAEGTIFRYYKTKEELLTKLYPLAFQLAMPRMANDLVKMVEKQPKMDAGTMACVILKDRVGLILMNRKFFKAIIPEILYRTELREKIRDIMQEKIEETLKKIYEDRINNKEAIAVDYFVQFIFSTMVYYVGFLILFSDQVEVEALHKNIEAYVAAASKDWSK